MPGLANVFLAEMAKISWDKNEIFTEEGPVKAVEPLIISASRSTDIPAFFSKWLIKRLEAGYLKWINPFNQKAEFVSLQKARVFVFWSKNPEPLLEYLSVFDTKGIGYYFQFTLNDYEKEGLEPKIPPLKKRISVFKALSEKIGKEKVIWRFDPLILTNKIGLGDLLEKIEKVGNSIYPYTEKLIFSFADILQYRKVQNNLNRSGVKWKEWTKDSIIEIAKGLNDLNSKWGLKVATCAEKVDLKEFGIAHNKCIDDELIARLFPRDHILMDFLGYSPGLFSLKQKSFPLKDPGQRLNCGCIISKDIGQYNTCPHLCVYCYANASKTLVLKNYKTHDPNSSTII